MSTDNGPVEKSREVLATLPKFGLILSGLVYAAGFLVLNSYLAKYGEFERNFLDQRIIVCGLLYMFFALCWFFFSGRSILNMPSYIGKESAFYFKIGMNEKWMPVLFFYSMINFLVMTCMSTFAFAAVSLNIFVDQIFYASMALYFLWSYYFDVTNRDIKHPRTTLLLKLCSELIVFVGFIFSCIIEIKILYVFLAYFGMSMFVNMVADSFDRRGVTNDRLIFSLFMVSTVFLSSAIMFGQTIYGEVKRKIGGGQFYDVQIFFKNSDDVLKSLFSDNAKPTVTVFHESADRMLILHNGETYSLMSDQIRVRRLIPIIELSYTEKLSRIYQLMGVTLPIQGNKPLSHVAPGEASRPDLAPEQTSPNLP